MENTSKKEVRPELAIKHLLTPSLTRSDYATVMRFVRALVKSDDQWKFNYHSIKSSLSSQLTQEQYQRVVKQLNAVVRPYRRTK